MAEEPQERRFRYLPWGIAGWLAITAICLLTHLGTLESDLVERSQGALATAGLAGQITDGQVEFTGEIATLRGTVADEPTRAQIEATVADVRGVRRVENLIDVVPVAAIPEPVEPAEPTAPLLRSPRLAAAADGATITLTGEVPTRTVADAWVEAAGSIYGPDNVVDQLTVTDEVAVESWFEGRLSLETLAQVTNGSMTIGDNRVVVTGTAANDAIRDRVLSALASELPGVTIDDRLEVVPPAAEEIASLDLSGITFDTASATITAESVPTLQEAVRTLQAFPLVEVEVGGHTDSDGSDTVNLALSQARAEAVVAYLVDQGISPDRLTAVGYGETQPVADNDTPEGKAQNRRIEFLITEGA